MTASKNTERENDGVIILTDNQTVLAVFQLFYFHFLPVEFEFLQVWMFFKLSSSHLMNQMVF